MSSYQLFIILILDETVKQISVVETDCHMGLILSCDFELMVAEGGDV